MWIYAVLSIYAIFMLTAIAIHIPTRYVGGNIRIPSTFRDRLADSIDGWWVNPLVYSLFYVTYVAAMFFYREFSSSPKTISQVVSDSWKVYLLLLVIGIANHLSRSLENSSEGTMSLRQVTIKTIASIQGARE